MRGSNLPYMRLRNVFQQRIDNAMGDNSDGRRDDATLISNLKDDHAIVRECSDQRAVELVVEHDADGLTIAVVDTGAPARIIPFPTKP